MNLIASRVNVLGASLGVNQWTAFNPCKEIRVKVKRLQYYFVVAIEYLGTLKYAFRLGPWDDQDDKLVNGVRVRDLNFDIMGAQALWEDVIEKVCKDLVDGKLVEP